MKSLIDARLQKKDYCEVCDNEKIIDSVEF